VFLSWHSLLLYLGLGWSLPLDTRGSRPARDLSPCPRVASNPAGTVALRVRSLVGAPGGALALAACPAASHAELPAWAAWA